MENNQNRFWVPFKHFSGRFVGLKRANVCFLLSRFSWHANPNNMFLCYIPHIASLLLRFILHYASVSYRSVIIRITKQLQNWLEWFQTSQMKKWGFFVNRAHLNTSSLSSLLSDPLGGAVCGCRVLGAGRPGEDGPGATAHCKNTERDIREMLIEMFGEDVHLSYNPTQNTVELLVNP